MESVFFFFFSFFFFHILFRVCLVQTIFCHLSHQIQIAAVTNLIRNERFAVNVCLTNAPMWTLSACEGQENEFIELVNKLILTIVKSVCSKLLSKSRSLIQTQTQTPKLCFFSFVFDSLELIAIFHLIIIATRWECCLRRAHRIKSLEPWISFEDSLDPIRTVTAYYSPACFPHF
jgi:hypothetical protein